MRDLRVCAFVCLLVLIAGCRGSKKEGEAAQEDKAVKRSAGIESPRSRGSGEVGPTEANLKKLAGGMTLAEVEAIIGKGTAYSDLDLTKVDLGFSVEDPAA